MTSLYLGSNKIENEITITMTVDSTYPYCNITIPSGVTEIFDEMFSSYLHIKSITIPSTVTRIGKQAFYNVSFETNMPTLPSGLKIIDEGAFQLTDWTGVAAASRSLTFPASVTTLGASMMGTRSNPLSFNFYFAGNCPATLGTNFAYKLALTVYTKSNNTKWTSTVKNNFKTKSGASSITWKTY